MAIPAEAEKDIGGKPEYKEIVLISLKGIKYRVYVDNDGTLLTEAI